jgi:hypothetical protein
MALLLPRRRKTRHNKTAEPPILHGRSLNRPSIQNARFIKLVAGEATDYSGHGSGDMELAEYFIQNWLHLRIEERPLSYLLDDIKSELWKLTGGEKA